MICLNNYKKLIFPLIISVGFIILFFADPSSVSKGVRSGLSLCGEAIIPSLFPFMILSDFIVRSGLGIAVGKIFSVPSEKIFRLPGCSACVILMSLIGGFPVGAKMIAQLYEDGLLSDSQAKRMMWFCVNSGPAFVVGTVGAAMLSDKRCGIILFASQTVSSLAVGLCSRFFPKNNVKQSFTANASIDCSVLTDSVASATQAMLNVCAWVLLFSAFTPFLAQLADRFPLFNFAIVMSEVTGGCAFAAKRLPPCLLAPILCWSGFAVHMQLLPYIKSIGMRLPEFWISRAVNCLLALPIAYFLFKAFPCKAQVFSHFSDVVIKPYSVSIPASAAMLLLGAFTIIDINLASDKKM